LVVDDLLASEEIVVKPLSRVLREIGLFSGATVLGNGSLALILDVAALAALAGVTVAETRGAPAVVEPASSSEDGLRFLVFAGAGPDGAAERMAMPLEQVERIESVAARSIESVGEHLVLQHRGEALAVDDPDGLLGRVASGSEDREVTMLICREGSGAETGAPNPANHPSVRRSGMVVGSASHVAAGTMLRPLASLGGECRMALIEGRLTRVRDAFARGPGRPDVADLREVA
jgi:two-component system chemotaxis sensor kinase CheA